MGQRVTYKCNIPMHHSLSTLFTTPEVRYLPHCKGNVHHDSSLKFQWNQLPMDCSALNECLQICVQPLHHYALGWSTIFIFVLPESEELNHIGMAKTWCPVLHFIVKSLLVFLDCWKGPLLTSKQLDGTRWPVPGGFDYFTQCSMFNDSVQPSLAVWDRHNPVKTALRKTWRKYYQDFTKLPPLSI